MPILSELRILMDWMCTDTSLTFWNWWDMEKHFADIYQQKCKNSMKSEYPQPPRKKKRLLSLVFGWTVFFIVLVVTIFPLGFSAYGSTFGHSNLPYEVKVKMVIGQYVPIYEMSAENTFSTIDT